jgi:hypothetical protein
MNYNGKRQRYNQNIIDPNIDQKKKPRKNIQRKKKKPENFMPPKGTPECKHFISETTNFLLEGFITSFKTKVFPYIIDSSVFCLNKDRYEGIETLKKLRNISTKYSINVSKYNSWQHGGRAIGINASGYIIDTNSRNPISMTFFFTHHQKWTLRSLSMVSF